jgi:FlaA1/EpsC-like NDP-sugar epimerase
VLCSVLVAGSRLVFRTAALLHARRSADARTRVLVVGAGRFGRSVARELQETPGTRVVGFLDDNPAVRRRRVRGVTVVGGTHEIERALQRTRPDEVLITIPDAPADRLDRVVEATRAAGVPCRLVRRQTEVAATLVETNAS